jgi:hypothetical protein
VRAEASAHASSVYRQTTPARKRGRTVKDYSQPSSFHEKEGSMERGLHTPYPKIKFTLFVISVAIFLSLIKSNILCYILDKLFRSIRWYLEILNSRTGNLSMKKFLAHYLQREATLWNKNAERKIKRSSLSSRM